MKLLLATPCNMVLEDAITGHCLIGIFYEIQVQIGSDVAEVSSNAMVPRDWALFVKFELDAEEEGKGYSLSSSFFFPDGTLLQNTSWPPSSQLRTAWRSFLNFRLFPWGKKEMCSWL